MRTMSARLVSWAALGVIVVGALVWAAWPDGGASAPARARALAAELRCPDCEGLSVADSFTTSGRAIRRDIARRIEAGQSDARIRRAYVERYGESILLNPQGGGLGVLVWGLPAIVLILGGAGVAWSVLRWRHQAAAPVTDADEALVARARERG